MSYILQAIFDVDKQMYLCANLRPDCYRDLRETLIPSVKSVFQIFYNHL
jgi:hypothetical protein